MTIDDDYDYWADDPVVGSEPKRSPLRCEAIHDIEGAFPAKLSDWFSSPSGHYLLVDASRCDQILGEDDIKSLADGHYCRSLFTKADLAHVAPWLINLDRLKPDQSDRFDHQLMRIFFRKLWGQRAGILIRTEADFERLFSHLRTFTMVGDETSSKLFFRYWDPLVAGVYFPGVINRPERVDQLLKTADDRWIEMLIEDGPTRASVLMVSQHEENSSGRLNARKPLIMDARDKVLLGEVTFRALGLELGTWFVDAFPDRMQLLTDDGRTAAVHHVVETGRSLGLRMKEDYSYLAHIMVHFGSWFFEIAATPNFNKVLFDPTILHKHRALEEVFFTVWKSSVSTALSRRRAEVHNRLLSVPKTEWVSPELFKLLSHEILSDRTEALNALVAGARPAAKAAGFSIEKEGQHILMSLFFGHRYQDDPFRPWVGMPIDEALALAWQSVFKGT